MRIVSLVPSLTELLADLQLSDEVVGITKFCIHPHEWFTHKTRIGGTKNISIAIIKSLHPDLIIANKEENVKEQVEALQTFTNVYCSDITNLKDAISCIHTIGNLVSRNTEANTIAQDILQEFESLQTIKTKLKTAYLIWKDPYMAAGGGTFIHDMLQRCGFENMLQQVPRYPNVSVQQLYNEGCELLLLSSEPYPFKQKHITELQQHLPNTKIALVDGEMFSWYGSHLLQSPTYFSKLLQAISV